MDPLVSVIVPVYNGEKYLSECLDSLINQLYRNIEVVVVNDGSTDGTKEILDAYVQKDSRIKAIHKENGGVSSARNAALDRVHGKYIHFCDADDWVSIDMYKSTISLMESLKIDFVAVNTYMHQDNMPPALRMTTLPEGKYNKLALVKYCCGVLGRKNHVTTSFLAVNDKIFKRSLLYERDGTSIQFKEGMKYLEDGKYLIDALANVKSGYYLKKAYYHRRINDESAMGKLDIFKLSKYMLTGYETIMECSFAKDNPIVKKYIMDAYERAAFFYVKQSLEMECDDAVKEIRNRLKDNMDFQQHCDDYYQKISQHLEEK